MHVGRLGSLTLNAIHPGDDLELAPVQATYDPGADRTKGVESLGPAPLPIRLLQIPAGDVVHAHIAADGPLCRRRICVADPLGDDHPDLRLELHPGGDVREMDRVTGPDQRRRGLEEDDRNGRHLIPQLTSVLHVVPPDPDDLAGADRNHTAAPIPCRAKKSSHLVRICAQLPSTRSDRGSQLSSSGPYRLVTTRLSSRMTTPVSSRLRIKRPNPCFSFKAACGRR